LTKIHLAILKQPFLQYILEGKKTIESRATKVKCAPYGKVRKGDLIYLRESGDFAVIGKAIVEKVVYSEDPIQIQKYLRIYSKELCISKDFIKSKKDAKYITLIWLTKIKRIMPFPFVKHDRRAWIVDFREKDKEVKTLEELLK